MKIQENQQKRLIEACEKIKLGYPEYSNSLEAIVNGSIKEAHAGKEPMKIPIVILAGGASLMDEVKVDAYRQCIRELMAGFKGTIISGGTTAGIPGLVGEVKAELEKMGPVAFDLIGYLPKNIPSYEAKSKGYDKFYETDSNKFSILEAFYYWADIILSGINPSEVILFGINGGKISMLEYLIALSLGAKVCLLTNSGRSADELLQDKDWNNSPNLVKLHEDPRSFREVLNQIK